MIILADLWQSFASGAGDAWRYLLLALGLGFVVFFHELGHFLAAKYAGVSVEQFAVGFGNAAVAWRKGIGIRRGTTTPEMERRVQAYVAEHRLGPEDPDAMPTPPQTMRAMAALGLGETEYRLNWIPLGGYVKMLGQDDLDPTSLSNDPRSYNMKPIPKRMLIVSAGVLMNVLLAAIGFMIVFLMGFRAPPAEVGGVLNDSPASMAIASDGSRRSLQVGDRILSFNGSHPSDFAKIALATALVKAGDSIPIEVRHPDGQVETLHLTPAPRRTKAMTIGN
ncbi:MAG: site-2 protease family protein [Tepidisphaeraceae bacterium]